MSGEKSFGLRDLANTTPRPQANIFNPKLEKPKNTDARARMHFESVLAKVLSVINPIAAIPEALWPCSG